MFSRVTPFIWGAETLERRVFNLACGVRSLTERASDVEAAELLALLARQTRHLLKLDGGPLRRAERGAVAAIVATALAGVAGERLKTKAFNKLVPALAHRSAAGRRAEEPLAGAGAGAVVRPPDP